MMCIRPLNCLVYSDTRDSGQGRGRWSEQAEGGGFGVLEVVKGVGQGGADALGWGVEGARLRF